MSARFHPDSAEAFQDWLDRGGPFPDDGQDLRELGVAFDDGPLDQVVVEGQLDLFSHAVGGTIETPKRSPGDAHTSPGMAPPNRAEMHDAA